MTRCTRKNCTHTAEPSKTITGQPLCHRHLMDDRWAARSGSQRYARNAQMTATFKNKQGVYC